MPRLEVLRATRTLSKLSPSMRVPRVFAAPSSLSRATTATGSVADAMMPISQHTQIVHVAGAIVYRRRAVMKEASAIAGKAISRI